jgi:hypothetical protein
LPEGGGPTPPPRFPRPGDPELVRITEDKAADTERLPIIPPAPPVPREPFAPRVINGRPASYVEFQAQLSDFSMKLEAVISSEAAVLGVQRKMALQLDGLGQTVNQRFDLFHKELAMLRARVTGTEQEVKKLTPGEKAKLGMLITAKLGAAGAGLLLVAGPLLRALAKAYPDYAHLIDAILGML